MIKSILEFGLTRRAIVVLGVIVFSASGLIAFTKLNIEAYPNPGAGHSRNHRAGAGPVRRGDGEILHDPDGDRALPDARRRQRPLDVVLWPSLRPRDLQIWRRLLLRLSAGRHQRFNRTSPFPAISRRRSSNPASPAKSIRYQVVGPPHFGLTNLRTMQDWIVTRRLLTIPGVVQINCWGGTTKQFDVDVDPQKARSL